MDGCFVGETLVMIVMMDVLDRICCELKGRQSSEHRRKDQSNIIYILDDFETPAVIIGSTGKHVLYAIDKLLHLSGCRLPCTNSGVVVSERYRIGKAMFLISGFL